VSDRQINYAYYEEVTPPIFFQYFLYSIIGLLMYLISTRGGDIPPILGVLGIGVVFVLTTVFGRLTIAINDSELTVGFGLLKHRLALENIDYVEVRPLQWWKYGGFGVRYGFDWSVAYVVNYNRGVRVVPKRGRVFFFSTNRPEEVADRIVELSRIKVGSQ
jgi:hypothetical protein